MKKKKFKFKPDKCTGAVHFSLSIPLDISDKEFKKRLDKALKGTHERTSQF